MPIASINRHGVKLSCRAVGSSGAQRAVLLVHGLNTNIAFWHPLLMRRLSADRLTVAFDQRGHGASDMPQSGYTLDDLAADALAVLDGHEIAAADLIAHSFGSGIALQLARRHPERVASLTILDGRLRSLQADVRLRDWAHFERWSARLAAAGMQVDGNWEIDCRLPLRLEAVDFSKVADGLEGDGFFVPRLNNKRAGAKYRRLMTETSALAEYDRCVGLTADVLPQIAQPTLLVYGDGSPFLPTCRVLADRLPNAKVELIRGGGHNFPLVQPGPTLAALERFAPLNLACEAAT